MSKHKFYGVLEFESAESDISQHVERIKRNGWTVVEDAIGNDFLEKIRLTSESTYKNYISHFGREALEKIDEHNGIRMPFSFNKIFLDIAKNKKVLTIVNALMGDNFVLNQQNYINNPSKENYNQDKWHRDLPYAHYTSSKPLMLNALFAIDDFTLQNGATKVLPGSHLFEKFPSPRFLSENQVVLEAKAGSYVVIDSMLYHAGGYNGTNSPRRAINNVYSSPHIKQQINYTEENTRHLELDEFEKN